MFLHGPNKGWSKWIIIKKGQRQILNEIILY